MTGLFDEVLGLGEDEESYWLGDDCGRWDNGKLRQWKNCSQAGTEFCQFECPLRDGPIE